MGDNMRKALYTMTTPSFTFLPYDLKNHNMKTLMDEFQSDKNDLAFKYIDRPDMQIIDFGSLYYSLNLGKQKMDGYDDRRFASFLVEDEDENIVGNVSFNQTNPASIEFTYFIFKKYRHLGIGSKLFIETLTELLTDDIYNIDKVNLRVNQENNSSLNIIQSFFKPVIIDPNNNDVIFAIKKENLVKTNNQENKGVKR